MDAKTLWRVAGTGLIVLIIAFVAVTYLSPDLGAVKDNAAALAAITAAAVGIERIIEGFWVVVEYLKGTWWPLNLINTGISDLVTSLDAALSPIYSQAGTLLNSLSTADQEAGKQLKDIGEWLTKLKADITPAAESGVANTLANNAPAPESTAKGTARKAPLDKQKVQLVLANASNAIDAISKGDTQLQTDLVYAKNVINRVSETINALNDNPGKRLISIFIGAFLGLVLAGVSGYDLFTLILGTSLGLHLGTAVTGIVIGLGSGPTHEVIGLLKEIKLNRRQENAS